MMNRRELFAVGGAGVVGLLLPSKVEAASTKPMLEGLTDEKMANLIAEVPQNLTSWLMIGKEFLRVFEQFDGAKSINDWMSWRSKGKILQFIRFHFDSTCLSKQDQGEIDVKSLICVNIYRGNEERIVRYVRLEGVNGWFRGRRY